MKDFNLIYKKYYSMVFEFVSDKINNVQDIEEVTNDIFIKLKNTNFDLSKNQFGAMIYLTARNTVIDFNKAKHQIEYINISEYDCTEIVDDNKTNDIVENKELLEAVYKAINVLKPKYKRIAELYFLDDKPYLEIATLLELPIGTVKPMVNRIRTMLQNNNELKSMYQEVKMSYL
jgi:RNA polymerase sigma factor (sigma-70 family)